MNASPKVSTTAFSATHWQLATPGHAAMTLAPITADAAAMLGHALISIDPWQRMNYSPSAMTTYLAASEPGTCRRAICRDGTPIGAVSVRYPWLRGPYLELLGLLPGHQGLGAGAAILDWMAAEARGRANSLWVCTSTFNARALTFYQRHGFVAVGDLEGLVGPEFTEVLLRRKL
jgi:diamine N-acetyltransferase